jgi:predicted PolB exonuclease-like 3'-5' exonuclease
MNVLVFDIETVPDVEGGRLLYHLPAGDDKKTVEKMREIRRAQPIRPQTLYVFICSVSL